MLGLCNHDPTVDVHLTKKGIQQAKELAKELKAAKIDLIIISELARTKQSANILNEFHGAPLIVDARLNDICNDFEGGKVADYRELKAKAPNPFLSN